MAIDLAASVMFFPGLEAQLGLHIIFENGANEFLNQIKISRSVVQQWSTWMDRRW